MSNTMEMDSNTKYKDGVHRNARIIIRNISFKATEESLKEHFSTYGDVEEIKLLKKPDGKLVGCAFIHFTHVPMANKAIKETNKKFLGKLFSDTVFQSESIQMKQIVIYIYLPRIKLK